MPSSAWKKDVCRSEENTSELQSLTNLVCRLLLEKKIRIYQKRGSNKHARNIAFFVPLAMVKFNGELVASFFFLMTRRPPRSTPFPYPPLFRSLRDRHLASRVCATHDRCGRALSNTSIVG